MRFIAIVLAALVAMSSATFSQQAKYDQQVGSDIYRVRINTSVEGEFQKCFNGEDMITIGLIATDGRSDFMRQCGVNSPPLDIFGDPISASSHAVYSQLEKGIRQKLKGSPTAVVSVTGN